MKIIEDINYSLEDIVSQIKDTFGFIYTSLSDDLSRGYFIVGKGTKLNIKIDNDLRELVHADLTLPDKILDLSEESTVADVYSSSIESSVQIVDMIKRMLGGEEDIND